MATKPSASRPWIIDSHVHLDILHQRLGPMVNGFREHHCTVISWAYSTAIHTTMDLKFYLNHQARTIAALHEQNPWGCFFLAGIHPRNIPPDLEPQKVAGLLTPYLSHPLCLGLGEIGLETGAQREKEIFQAQLELARSLLVSSVRVGVHTPRGNKKALTATILAILDHYQELHPVTVVDHCNAETLAEVLDRGLWAGVTLSPPKTAVQALPDLVAGHPQALSRLMCNTDSMEEFYPDLMAATQTPLLRASTRQQITQINAAQFWGLEIDSSARVVRAIHH